MKTQVLIVEDEAALVELLRYNLEKEGFRVTSVADGEEALSAIAENPPDLVILDWMLPLVSGLEVCRQIRRKPETRELPVIMLTARGEEADRVRGLEGGADDYVSKPFSPSELVARVRALMRRARAVEGAVLKHADLEMDLSTRRVHRAGQPIRLSTKEFALLEYFLRNPHRVLTRTMIGEHVWDMTLEEESNVIEVYVSRLRSKVDKGFQQRLIHTIIGTGYVLSSDGPPG